MRKFLAVLAIAIVAFVGATAQANDVEVFQIDEFEQYCENVPGFDGLVVNLRADLGDVDTTIAEEGIAFAFATEDSGAVTGPATFVNARGALWGQLRIPNDVFPGDSADTGDDFEGNVLAGLVFAGYTGQIDVDFLDCSTF